MPIAVRIYRSESGEAGKRTSGTVSRHAIPYKDIMQMSMTTLKAQLSEWNAREAELRGRKDEQKKVALKVAQLNIRRLGRRLNALYNKLPDPRVGMPVDAPGKTYWCQAPVSWEQEERIDEIFFLQQRERRLETLRSIIRSGSMVKVEIVFKDDQMWFRCLRDRKIIREDRVSDLMTMREAREVLRAGTEDFLGTAFRAILTMSNK